MPDWLDECVGDLLSQKDFYPKRKDRESLAYAICQKQHKKSFPMRITKATMRGGGMYWQGAISDDGWDKEDERLSPEIFTDFQRQHKAQHENYQPPFVSLAHYDRMADGSGEIATVENIWTDGRVFHNDGWFHPTRLGKRVFEVVKTELERQEAGEEIENPVRFSIGFWDHTPPDAMWEGDPPRRVYLKGQYDHVALTRVPVNPRTGFTQLTEKSMTTQREDALSIVGPDYEEDVDELDKQQPIGKSQAEGMVVKSEEEDSPLTIEQDIILRAELERSGVEKSEIVDKATSDYEAGRIDGFKAAMGMINNKEVTEPMSEEAKKPETKADVDLDAILEAVKQQEPEKPEQKAEAEPPDNIDAHIILLKQTLSDEGAGRTKKQEVAEAVLRSLVVHVSKAIDATTPPSPEDVANSIEAQMERALRPLMDKVAVLEEAVLGRQGDAPKSKALSFAQEPFHIPPEASFLAAQNSGGPAGEQSPLSQMINESCGLPKDFRRKQTVL